MCRRLQCLKFSPPVTHVYNPVDYAWQPHEKYLRLYGNGGQRVLFLGMNPGPFGMAQTGVPFGEIAAVRDWMHIQEPVSKPAGENPKRPIDGFNCIRSEVSGRRLWGLAASRFGTARSFFKEHFVANYCPLVFMDGGGRNVTPDKISRAEMAPVLAACDQHLGAVLEALAPAWAIGVGAFAEQRLRAVAGPGPGLEIARILHPSPASPAANRGWAEAVTRQLRDLRVWD